MSHFLFMDRDGQTPLPHELQKGLRIKSIQTVGELDEYEEDNIAKGLSWLAKQYRDCEPLTLLRGNFASVGNGAPLVDNNP